MPDNQTICFVTSGAQGFCSTIAGTFTFSGAITFSAAGTAVTVSNNALVSGTMTVTTNFVDSALTASKCVGTDGSKNLVSTTNCLNSISTTSPITNSGTATAPIIACTICVTTAGGQSIGGVTTFAGLIDSALTASNCVGTDASKNLASNTNCVQSVAVTSPIGNSGTGAAPNFTCTTCVTTAGGQSIAGTTTFAGLIDSALTASNCVGSDASKNLVSNTNCIQSLTAGNDINTLSGAAPTVAVTNAPTFTGTLTASGGGALTGTFTGTPTFNGAVIFSGGPSYTGSTLLAFNYTAGGGTVANTNTNLTTFNCATTVSAYCYSFQAPTSGTGGSAVFQSGLQTSGVVNTTISAGVGSTGSQAVTPGSMANITVGQSLLIGPNTTNVESVTVTATTSTTFTANFVNTHAASVVVDSGTFFYANNPTSGAGLAAGGGVDFIAPAGYQGSANDPAGIVEITVPTEASGVTNVPYDIALLGSQQGQIGKAQHQIFVSSSSTTEDDLMILFGPSSQLTLNSSAPKCLTLNTGTGGTTTTPSIFIFKCNGDFSAFGNISANSTSNGTGEVNTGGAGVVTGANAIGDIHIGGGNTTNNTSGTQVGNCSGGGNPCGGHYDQNIYFEDNGQNAAAQTCTAPFICEYISATTQPTSYKLTFIQSFVQKPYCALTDYTHPADVPTAVTWTGSSPYTAVTFTVTTSIGDDVIVACGPGNGP